MSTFYGSVVEMDQKLGEDINIVLDGLNLKLGAVATIDT
jgi:hypothetical protein